VGGPRLRSITFRGEATRPGAATPDRALIEPVSKQEAGPMPDRVDPPDQAFGEVAGRRSPIYPGSTTAVNRGA
jgi:hypothetical protein